MSPKTANSPSAWETRYRWQKEHVIYQVGLEVQIQPKEGNFKKDTHGGNVTSSYAAEYMILLLH